MCIYFIREWRFLQFNVDSERQIFENFFHNRFILLSEFLSPKKYFHIFVLMPDLGYEPGLLCLNKPTHYLLDYGGFANKIKFFFNENIFNFLLHCNFYNKKFSFHKRNNLTYIYTHLTYTYIYTRKKI